MHQWHGYRQKKSSCTANLLQAQTSVGASLVWDLALMGESMESSIGQRSHCHAKIHGFSIMPDRKKTGSIITPNKEAPFPLRNNDQINYSLEAAAE